MRWFSILAVLALVGCQYAFDGIRRPESRWAEDTTLPSEWYGIHRKVGPQHEVPEFPDVERWMPFLDLKAAIDKQPSYDPQDDLDNGYPYYYRLRYPYGIHLTGSTQTEDAIIFEYTILEGTRNNYGDPKYHAYIHVDRHTGLVTDWSIHR